MQIARVQNALWDHNRRVSDVELCGVEAFEPGWDGEILAERMPLLAHHVEYRSKQVAEPEEAHISDVDSPIAVPEGALKERIAIALGEKTPGIVLPGLSQNDVGCEHGNDGV